jgi:hypothetical protein
MKTSKILPAVTFALVLSVGFPALAEPIEAGNPLGPCLKGDAPPSEDIMPTGTGWGVQIASAFSEQEALDDFSKVQKDYSDILGDYSPTVIAVCNLNLGTDLRYSVRVAFDDRDAADKLCARLQKAGGACIVLRD